ncbi:hypothetical protein VKT23_019861 [Stygiomarasmius scandens]|uniref:Uncharacterized protein n=1 Tax=Marasmiellus scandens TaxID=2682957 RepID=A0ABR1IKF1_9AGAR
MSSGDVLMILDAASIPFSGGWHRTDQSYYFGGHMAAFGGPTNNNQTGNFNVSFQGTNIAFFGETNGTSTFQVQIDDDDPFDAMVPDFGAQSNYTQWYQVPTLEDGIHTIKVSELQGGLDYVVITAGPSTPFNETTNIMVDDDDTSEIHYSGDWDRNTDIITINGGRPSGPPLGNTTHRTNTVGDSFIFQFAGTSVSLYGVFLGTETGSIDVGFNLDGQVSTKRIFVSPGAPPAFDESPNYLFFSASELEAGNHTLSANITDASGSQKFVLDYILYTPSFSTLSSKPTFALPQLPSSSVGSGPVSTAGSGSVDSQKGSSSAPMGAIIGGVASGIIVILLMLLTIFLIRRQRTSSRRHLLNPRLSAGSAAVTPYLQSCSSASATSSSGSGASQGIRTEKEAIMPQHHQAVGPEEENSTQLQINALRQQIHNLTEAQRGNEVMQELPPAYS